MAKTTAEAYNEIVDKCLDVFEKKTKDYGTAWRILRPSSLTDQINIKAHRIRSIQEKAEQKIDDPISDEFMGMINYCCIGLVQLELTDSDPMEMAPEKAVSLYRAKIESTKNLMLNKNHDYGEAWRLMRVSSITDIILMKILRIKQIEDNAGATIISEGIDAGYQDIINYSVFALILMDEGEG